jgi:histone-lysine N-methyltransferase SETMAR
VPVSVAQRIIIKFLSGEGVKPAEILRRLTEQFKEETLSRAQVFAWHKHFVEGREHVENEGHDRRPSTSLTAGQLARSWQLFFFGWHGLLHIDCLHERRTLNTAYYCEVQHAYRLKRRDLSMRDVVLLQDNAHPHTASVTQRKLEQLGWKTLEHPPYSPDLPPCDFHVFGPLNEALGGQRFNVVAGVEAYVRSWLQTRPTSFYEDGISKLPICWECVLKAGEYMVK